MTVKSPEIYYVRQGTKLWGTDTNNSDTFANFVRGGVTRYGNSVVNYRDKIAKNVDASSNYTYTKDKYTLGTCVGSWHRKSTGKNGSFYCRDQGKLYSVFNAPPIDDALRDRALKKLKAKLSNDRNHFKALVPLGEIKETYGLIRTTSKATEGLLKGFLELKRGNPRNIVKAASDAWLQYSFAIAPTIHDLQSVFDSITEFQNREDIVKTYSASASKSWLEQRTGGTIIPALVSYDSQTTNYLHTLKYRYAAGVKHFLRSDNNYGIQQQFGLLGTDIIPAFWELIPLSFVADYFGTMGDYLTDVFEVSGGSTFYCTLATTYTADIDEFYKLKYNINPDIVYGFVTPSFLNSRKYTNYQRISVGQVPRRSLRLKTADEIAANSVKRVLNLSSLLLSNLAIEQNRPRVKSHQNRLTSRFRILT